MAKMASGLEKAPVRLAGGHPLKPARIGGRKRNSPGLARADHRAETAQELAAFVCKRGEASVRADAIAAAILAEAAARTAATLVEVNLATMESDPRVALAHEHLARAEQSRKRAVETA